MTNKGEAIIADGFSSLTVITAQFFNKLLKFKLIYASFLH